MRVLVVTNMFPTRDQPLDGIFIQRQVAALCASRSDLVVDVCHVATTRSRWNYISGISQVFREVRKFRPDIIHVHYGLSLWLCMLVRGLPMVVTMHGSDLTIPWQRLISSALLRRKADLILVSPILAKFLPGRERFSIVPCGVDSKRFSSSQIAARQSLNIATGIPLIVFGSNPSRPVKRYDRFLEVVSRVRDTRGDVMTMCLSDVKPSEVSTLLAAADVLLLTSDREGSPVVTKEALCAGLRVVSTPVGDVAEQLAGFDGCIVSGWDAERLSSDVCAALNAAPPQRDIAAERFDHSVEVRRILEIYQGILQR